MSLYGQQGFQEYADEGNTLIMATGALRVPGNLNAILWSSLEEQMKRAICVLILLAMVMGLSAQSTSGADLQTTAHSHRFTVNTDPFTFLLGYFYITFDIKVSEHFILGNAIGFRIGQWALIPGLRDDIFGISYTCGLAWFHIGSDAQGFHLAGFISPMVLFHGDGRPVFSPNIGAYAGYSLHFWNRLKISLKLGGIFQVDDLSTSLEGMFLPHISAEFGYMFDLGGPE